MARGLVVALGGASGSGKSTVVATLGERFGWVPLEEAYYRLRPRPSLRFGSQRALRRLELRLLDEEARRFREARALVAGGRTVVADTGFLDPVSYTAGLYVLGLADRTTMRAVVRRAGALARRRRLGVPDLAVLLSVPPSTRAARAAADPARHPRALRQRHESVGWVETELVAPCLAAALPGGLRTVRAEAPPEVVAGRIRRAARRAPRVRDPYRALVAALAALAQLPALRPALAGSGNLKSGTLSPRPPR